MTRYTPLPHPVRPSHSDLTYHVARALPQRAHVASLGGQPGGRGVAAGRPRGPPAVLHLLGDHRAGAHHGHFALLLRLRTVRLRAAADQWKGMITDDRLLMV